ncbi:MAG: DUF11 domain-containing protein [bacterium]|nr:DUF11 domain-containing protein [bacterium]
MATVNLRYVNLARGSVVITGNTVGLDKASNTLLPGTVGSVGARLSTVNSSVASGWSSQAALDPGVGIRVDNNTALVGSKAVLYIPPSSTVLYAELVWFATNYNGVNPDSPVTFFSPLAQAGVSVTGATETSNLINMDGYTIYVRSNNVTNYVSAGTNTYEVRGIPSLLVSNNNNDTCMGWCLMAAYQNAAEDYKNMSIYVLGVAVQTATPSVNVTVPNVVTPISPPVRGRAVMASAEGDIFITGDYVRFGATITSQATLSGPNNPSTNFFTSSINVGDYNSTIATGTFDTRGTMGRNNHNLTNSLAGARQGIDITNVDISQGLTTNQTSAVLTFGTNGDKYAPVALGIEILVVPGITKTVSATQATLNDVLTFQVVIQNPGTTVAWSNVRFQDNIPAYTTFIANSVQFNGVVQPGLSPQTGFLVASTLPLNTSITVSFQVRVSQVPPTLPYTISNFATVTYMVNNIQQTVISNPTSTSFVYAQLSVSKTADPAENVSCGQVILYTITLSNTGNAELTIPARQFTDPISTTSSYVSNSLTPTSSGFIYNANTRQIENQIPITIPAGSSTTIKFNIIIQCN